MLFSDAKGRKVVSTTTAETVGKVDGFVVDPTSHMVVALQLKKTDEGHTLPWPQITGFGPDAVTIQDADLITEASDRLAELSDKDHQLVGKRLLSDQGDELGKVTDVEFDAVSGELIAIAHADGTVPGASLIGVGSYAVVVSGAL